MKNKIIAILAGLLVVSCALLYFSNKYAQAQKTEAERQSKNVEVLNKKFTSYKTAYRNSAAKVEALTYKITEMQTYESGLTQTIKELKLKPKNVISAAEITTQSAATIKTVIQYVDSTKCLNYQDDFTTVSGCFKGDSIDLKIENRDSLTTVISRVPKYHFLWWSWGVKAIQLDIRAKNPGTKFEYLKYIEVK